MFDRYRKVGERLLNKFFSEEKTDDVGEGVVGTNKQNWQRKPDDTIENILHTQVAGQ